VLSSLGAKASVFGLDPTQADPALVPIQAAPAPDGARIVMPVNLWNNGEFRDQYDAKTDHATTLAEMFARDMAQPKALAYTSPDGSISLPAFPVWQQGPVDHIGWRFSDTLDTHGFVTASAGSRVYLANSSENITYSGLVGKTGTFTDLKPFANRGGESVATDAEGRVYVANGQVFVYDRDGHELGRIDVPERPLQVLAGAGNIRLFILTHHGLYAVK